MNRRELLKRSLAVMPAITIPAVANLKMEDQSDTWTYKGWLLMWSGWQRPGNVDIIVAQWIAYPPPSEDRWAVCLYASCPGAAGAFLPGQLFNTVNQEGKVSLTTKSSAEDKAIMTQECRDRLCKLIDLAGPPPLQWNDKTRSLTI